MKYFHLCHIITNKWEEIKTEQSRQMIQGKDKEPLEMEFQCIELFYHKIPPVLHYFNLFVEFDGWLEPAVGRGGGETSRHLIIILLVGSKPL